MKDTQNQEELERLQWEIRKGFRLPEDIDASIVTSEDIESWLLTDPEITDRQWVEQRGRLPSTHGFYG